jgi:tRNA modification GTPase
LSGSPSKPLQGPASAGLCFAEDAIFALSTPGLPAAIAVIRISGKNCLSMLQPSIGKCKLAEVEARKMRLCQFLDNSQVLDEPLIVIFRGPNSFTGEDQAELHLHGSPFIVKASFRILKSLGFREAEPGEFSRRAFLNSKMDLTQAEGLRELIHAQTSDQWISARQQSEGTLRRQIESLRSEIIAAHAFLEARIDFPDEGETSDLSLEPALKRAEAARRVMQRLAASFEAGQISQYGLKVALIGSPNAGKSTLLNTLIGKDRAIVSEIPGTTRDYLEEACIMNGHMVRLIDTAGIRMTTDRIEQIGIDRSIAIANEADVILLLQACDESTSTESQDLEARLKTEKTIVIRTKSDRVSAAQLKNLDGDLQISAHSGHGLNELRNLIVTRFRDATARCREEAFITNSRHASAIGAAIESLDRFFDQHKLGAYDEFLAFELAESAKHLRSIIGEVTNDQILEKIFSEFCVGK